MCPCGSNKLYQDCCGGFISGVKLPNTPEELMRSRYTAYSQGNMQYIKDTMQSPALDQFDEPSAAAWAQRVQWLKLTVIQASQHATKGKVEFIAQYKLDGKKQFLHELSDFHFENGKWFYVDGLQK